MQHFNGNSDASVNVKPSENHELDCPICMQLLADPFVTPCGHTFCYDCISRHLETAKNCPCCQGYLTIELVHPNFLLNKIVHQARRGDFQEGSAYELIQRTILDSQTQLQPAQIESLLQLLHDLRRSSQQSERSTTLSLLLHFLRRAREDKCARLEELHGELRCLEQDLQQVQGAAAAGTAEQPGPAEGGGTPDPLQEQGGAAGEALPESSRFSKAESGGVQDTGSKDAPAPAARPAVQPAGAAHDAAAQPASGLPHPPTLPLPQHCVPGMPLGTLLPGMGPGWWPLSVRAQGAPPQLLHHSLAVPHQQGHAGPWATGFPGRVLHPSHPHSHQAHHHTAPAPRCHSVEGANSAETDGQQGAMAAQPSAPAAECGGGEAGRGVLCGPHGLSGQETRTGQGTPHLSSPQLFGQPHPGAALFHHSPFYHPLLLQQPGGSGPTPPLAACASCSALGNVSAHPANNGTHDQQQLLHHPGHRIQQQHQQQYALLSDIPGRRPDAHCCQGSGGATASGRAAASLAGLGTLEQSVAGAPRPALPPAPPTIAAAALQDLTIARGKRSRIASAFDDLQECYKQLRCARAQQQVAPGAGCTASGEDTNPGSNHVGGVVDHGLQEFSRILSMLTRYNTLQITAEIPRVPSRGVAGSGSASSNIISSLEFNREGTRFAAAGVSKRISIYEYEAVMAPSARSGCPPATPLLELITRSKLSCLAWNKHVPAHIASSDYEGVVAVWDVNSSRVIAEYEAHGKRIWCLDYCGEMAGSGGGGALLASASDDCTVKLWSTSSPNSVGQVELRANVCAVKWRPGSCHQLAIGSADHSAYLYDLRATAQPLMTLMGHRKAVSYVRFCGADDLVSASTDSTLRLWTLAAGVSDEERLHRVFEGHVNEKNFVGLAVDGDFIACGSETNDVFVYYKALSKPVASQNFASSLPGVEEDESCSPLTIRSDVAGREQHQFISAMCWKPGNAELAVANSQGSVKIMRLTGDGSLQHNAKQIIQG